MNKNNKDEQAGNKIKIKRMKIMMKFKLKDTKKIG